MFLPRKRQDISPVFFLSALQQLSDRSLTIVRVHSNNQSSVFYYQPERNPTAICRQLGGGFSSVGRVNYIYNS